MKKERAKIPVPEEEYYTLFGYPLTKEELNLAGRELLALNNVWLNAVTASWPPPKLSQKEVRRLQKEARKRERLIRQGWSKKERKAYDAGMEGLPESFKLSVDGLSPEALKAYDDSIAADESFRLNVALLRGKLKPSSKRLAKVVALDLNAHRWLIWVAARQKDKTFFKTLGECLMGKIKPLALNERDAAIVDIRRQYPWITFKEMACELKRRDLPFEDKRGKYRGLGMREKRLRDALPPDLQHLFPKRNRTPKRKKV